MRGACDDGAVAVHPGATELCDGLDTNCDGELDEGAVACTTFVPGDVATIQEAIENAADGDVVCVYSGRWAELVDFGGRSIAVVGEDADSTVLDAGGGGPVVRFVSGEGPGARLEGFTLTGGFAGEGGGILTEDSSPTLVDLIVRGNRATSGGGGLFFSGGAPSVTRVRVLDNEATWEEEGYLSGYGGGAYLLESDAILDNVDFAGNLAGNSGGGVAVDGGSPRFTHARIAENEVWGFGAGLYIGSGTPSLVNGVVGRNRARAIGTGAGGGILIEGGEPVFENVVIADNTCDQDAGALYAVDATPTFRNVVITANSAAGGVGGVMFVETTPIFEHSDLWGNSGVQVDGTACPGGGGPETSAPRPPRARTATTTAVGWAKPADGPGGSADQRLRNMNHAAPSMHTAAPA